MILCKRPAVVLASVLFGLFVLTGLLTCYRWNVTSGSAPRLPGISRKHFASPVSVGEKPMPRTMLAAKKSPIEAETFLYLSMGPDQPTSFTYNRGCFPMSALIFLTFKEPMNFENLTLGCNCTSVFYPKSSWTTGRNELLRQAVLLERSLGWRYEFFIFTDNDINFVTHPRHVPGDHADIVFRQLLVQYRPLRGSIRFAKIPLKPLNHRNLRCGVTTYTDACVDAYHRTGVDLLLPYVPVLDNMSWFMSAYIVNLLAAAIAPGKCHVYRQLGAEGKHLVHSQYPHGGGHLETGREWVAARELVKRHLVSHHIPGFSVRDDLQAKLKDSLFGKLLPNGTEQTCGAQPEGVDYSKLISHGLL